MAFSIQKYQQLIENISVSCRQLKRNPEGIILIAATKYSSVVDMNAALEAGITHVGENRVQDAIKKFPYLKLPCRKHFIGHLQINKVKKVVKFFDVIESIDCLELIEKLEIESRNFGKNMEVLLQVNIAEDDAKFGCDLGDVEILVESLVACKHLVFKGFMSIVPYVEHLEDARPWFKKMNEIFIKYRTKYSSIDTLSMGMSHDYIVALEEGATQVRIGSLLFSNKN